MRLNGSMRMLLPAPGKPSAILTPSVTKRHEATPTSTCVRKPADLPAVSRSHPINPVKNAAARILRRSSASVRTYSSRFFQHSIPGNCQLDFLHHVVDSDRPHPIPLRLSVGCIG